MHVDFDNIPSALTCLLVVVVLAPENGLFTLGGSLSIMGFALEIRASVNLKLVKLIIGLFGGLG